MSSEGGQWPLEPLGRLCQVSSGTTPSRAAGSRYFTHQGIPWVKTLDLNEGSLEATDESLTEVAVAETGVRVYPAQVVLLAMYGGWEQIGRTAILAVPAAVNQAISVLEVGSQLEPRYLLLALQHGKPRWSRYAASTRKDPNITKSDVLEFGVLVPPLPVQRRIVEVIDSFTEMERGIEASISKLRKVRRGALMASMAAIASEEPRAGWVRVPLKDIVPSVEYGVSEALDRDARGVPVLRMNNIRNGRIDADELRYCPAPVPAKLFLRQGDVLFNRTNSMEHIGKTAMWRDELSSATFASYLVRLIPDLLRVTPEYLVEWLMHPLVRQRVRSISTVAVQQVNVNPSRLRELEIDLPIDLAEQRRIVAMLEACDDQIERENEELYKLRELKQGLVDDLLSGRVAVSAVAA
ncbi:restriction endonuclease subunit S [Streptomyces sp. NPDC007896]|uniref:restriction endonuclease subunit S n=1 Tax=Streptomyces sp. NPDC007896 TaxID=3364784 RepID=UPI0036E941C0